MMMAPRSLQFASFTLDLDRLCLFGPDGQVALRPKSFEVLRYLLGQTGRVVGKEEVIKAVWPDVTVTDESLTRCISEVRRAIGDDNQQIIKTIPKRGYSAGCAGLAGAAMLLRARVGPRGRTRASAHCATKHELKSLTATLASVSASMSRCYARTSGSRWSSLARRDPEEAMKILEAVPQLMTQAVIATRER